MDVRESFLYDDAGNMIRHTFNDTTYNTFTYDYLNRPKTATYFDGESFTYTYYNFGALHTVTDANMDVTTYNYDDLRRPTSIAYPDGYTVLYTYDGIGNRKSLKVQPPGPAIAHEVTYNYDDLNRLISVTDDGATSTYTYNTLHLMTGVNLANGVSATYDYDDVYRVDKITYIFNSTTFDSYDYTYDAVGNRLEVDEYDGTHYQWIYDDAYRLTDEIHTPPSSTAIPAHFTYDDTGNRETQNVNGSVTTYSYNGLDQLESTTGAVAATYTYDIRGNLDTVVNSSGTTDYDYDARNLLDSVIRTDLSVVDYGYDHGGRRTNRTIGSSATRYVWDELSAYGDVILEADETNTTLAEYTLANGQLVSQNQSGALSYYAYDAQGSVRSLTNSSGTPTDEYDYTAFGELSNHSGSSDNPYLYTGQQFDDEIDLYSLRARYYDPSNGRFLSKDEAAINLENPIEINRYGYTANNPTTFADPSGYGLSAAYSKLTSILGAAANVALPLAKQAIAKSIWPFVRGGVGGAIGYVAGLMAYNLERGNELFEGWDWFNLMMAVVTVGVLSVTYYWLHQLANAHRTNKFGDFFGTGLHPDAALEATLFEVGGSVLSTAFLRTLGLFASNEFADIGFGTGKSYTRVDDMILDFAFGLTALAQNYTNPANVTLSPRTKRFRLVTVQFLIYIGIALKSTYQALSGDEW